MVTSFKWAMLLRYNRIKNYKPVQERGIQAPNRHVVYIINTEELLLGWRNR